MCQESCVKSHVSRVTCQESRVKSHVSRVMCQESSVKSLESRIGATLKRMILGMILIHRQIELRSERCWRVDDNMYIPVRLSWLMRVLFEVQDLSQASPATVSRLGMIYLTASELGWRPFVQSWLADDVLFPPARFSESIKALIESFFEKYVEEGLRWFKRAAGDQEDSLTKGQPLEPLKSAGAAQLVRSYGPTGSG